MSDTEETQVVSHNNLNVVSQVFQPAENTVVLGEIYTEC